MTKTFLCITNNNDKGINFILICHAACNEIGNFQWFLMDNPNDEKEEYLRNEVYESITLNSKWIGCHCNLPNNKYTEMLCQLSGNILNFVR